MRSLNSFQQIYKRVFAKNPFGNPVFSSYCALCGDLCNPNQDINSICIPCRTDLPTIRNPCQICSIPLASINNTKICGKCLHLKPFYQTSTIPLEYIFPNTIFVKYLKYKEKLLYTEVLSKSLLTSIQQKSTPLPDCIIPVPLHALRLIKRGYNQSELIAQFIAKQLDIPIDIKSCLRIKNTAQQTGFSNKDRQKNLRNAFTVNANISYKHVAIVDDVVTTGSTVNELARVLTQAGVETIEVWACTRTDFGLKDS